MCAEHTDKEFEDLAARNYNKLSKSTTNVSNCVMSCTRPYKHGFLKYTKILC